MGCLNGTVVVSGGLGALGREIVAEVVRRGARAVLLGRRPAKEVREELAVVGDCEKVTYVQAEASDREALERVFDGIEDLRAAVANAAVTRPEPFLEVTAEAWWETMRVNLGGTFFFAQTAARRMVAGGRGGSVVLVSSWAQEVPDYGNTAYSVSKAGLRMLGRCMALELGSYNIRVNTLALGIVDAGMARRHMAIDPEYAARAHRAVPLDRLQTAEEAARVTAFLCSDEASYITGSVLLADGGASLFRRDW